MKKLLGILGTITIAGNGMSGIVGNAPISVKSEINYLQTNNLENLNRIKRSWYSQSRNENRINSQRFSTGKRNYWPWFSRDNWIKIQKIYKESNTYDIFKPKFINLLNNITFNQNECPRNHYWKIANAIWNDFSTINNIYMSSKINYGLYMEIWDSGNLNKGSVKLQCFDNCPSNKFENIEEFIANTNLGTLNDNNQNTILTVVKFKNSNLDTSQLEVINKTNTSATIKAKNDSSSYYGNKKVSFSIGEDLNKLIKISNLENINKNSDTAILNELNFLNPDLDILQLEVINKTNTSATIKAKNNSNKYFDKKKIYYVIDNKQNKIINLNELIKKGIFLSFRDKNKSTTLKEIKNINTNDLIYSDVTATKNIEPTYNKNSKSICFGTTTLFNNLPEKQNMKTPSCKYTKETTVNSQITTGLSKTNSEEKRREQTSTSSMEHNWNIELSTSGEIWPFEEVSATAGVGGNYGSSNTNMSSETKTLSNTFDFSNSKTNEFKEISEVELPSQEIEVNPNQKIKVTASLDEVLAQVTLKLTQNIYGEIILQITNTSNEEKSFKISIKEIMQKLKEYNLLPQEITINNDDTITFNGKASRSLKKGFDGNIEFHEVK
ncbi:MULTISPECIES: ETX/MTX2 family pore-forming toxin [unclassified Spiroplasma]|uniref:ETX/MTX2 family pore-forming toxin n=1 Tax=unclassified Spiroplasma TaxID=2637901 RepID=UPI00313B954E